MGRVGGGVRRSSRGSSRGSRSGGGMRVCMGCRGGGRRRGCLLMGNEGGAELGGGEGDLGDDMM